MEIFLRLILPILFLIIGLISIVFANTKMKSFFMSSFLPSLLYSMLDLYLEEYLFAIINVAVVLLNSYLFFRLKEPVNKYLFIGGFFFLIVFIILTLIPDQNYLLEYKALLGIDFYFYLILNPIFMFPMLKLKLLPNREIPIKRDSIYSRDLKKRIGENKFSNNADVIYFVTIGSIWGIIKWWYQGNFIQGFLPISGWLFALSIVLVMFKNSKFSSMLVTATFPLMYLMITDGFLINEPMWISNLMYHLLIVLLGLYVLFNKKDADWEKVFVYGVWLRIIGIIWHLFIPGYLKSIHYFFYITFIDVVITPIIVYYLCSREKSVLS